jgi:hypothetical protein
VAERVKIVESKKEEEFLNDRRTGNTAVGGDPFLPFVKTAGIASIIFRLNHLRL